MLGNPLTRARETLLEVNRRVPGEQLARQAVVGDKPLHLTPPTPCPRWIDPWFEPLSQDLADESDEVADADRARGSKVDGPADGFVAQCRQRERGNRV